MYIMSKLTPEELKMRMDKTGSPCIGVCTTVVGDEICRGCGRKAQEVIDWNRMSTEARKVVADRLMIESIRRQIKQRQTKKDTPNDEDMV